MSKKTEGNVYTVIFAIAMVVVVGSILAFMASSLKPNIKENERIEKQQNILYAMGVNENDETSATFVSTEIAGEEFKKYITEQMVLTSQNGEIIKVQTREEYMAENNNQEPYLIDIKKQKSNGKNGEPRKLPLFIGNLCGLTKWR